MKQGGKHIWYVARKRVFDDDQQIRKGTVGYLVGTDGPLLVLNSLRRRIVMDRRDLVQLNGQPVAFSPTTDIICQALNLFSKVEAGDPASLHRTGCKNLLGSVQNELDGPCPEAATELKQAIEDLEHYWLERLGHYKSGEYFLQHIGGAILLLYSQ